MATQEHFVDLDSFKRLNSIPIRSTIETAFYGNNIRRIEDLKEAYELAKNSPGTIELTGMPVYKPVELGLPEGANVLLFNDGAVYGRCAAARRIIGEPNVNVTEMAALLREAVYNSRFRKYYRAEAIIGLDEDFMVKAHLMIPEGFENNLYSWMLNFQYINEEYAKRYEKSRPLANDGDIYVFADPYWTHPDYPLGLAFFSPEQNCAAILGMRYFGEYKKGTLTLGAQRLRLVPRRAQALHAQGRKQQEVRPRGLRPLRIGQVHHHAREARRQVRRHGAARRRAYRQRQGQVRHRARAVLLR